MYGACALASCSVLSQCPLTSWATQSLWAYCDCPLMYSRRLLLCTSTQGSISHFHGFSNPYMLTTLKSLSSSLSPEQMPSLLKFPTSTSSLTYLNQTHYIYLFQPLLFHLCSKSQLAVQLFCQPTYWVASTPLRHHFFQEAFLSPSFGAPWHHLPNLFSYQLLKFLVSSVSCRLHKLCKITLLYCNA